MKSHILILKLCYILANVMIPCNTTSVCGMMGMHNLTGAYSTKQVVTLIYDSISTHDT